MNSVEHDQIRGIVRALSEYNLVRDHPEGSLQRQANNGVIREFVRIGYSNESLRLFNDEKMAKEYLLVITDLRDVYALTKRENSQMLVDFPSYDNGMVPPINPHDPHSQYYSVDRIAQNPVLRRVGEREEAAAKERTDIPEPHGADMRAPSSVAGSDTREGPRPTSGAQDEEKDSLARQMARALVLHGSNKGTKLESVKSWDGKISLGEDEQTKVNAFRSVVIAFCGQNGLLDVLEQEVPVKIGKMGVSRDELVAVHSEKTVRQSYELWAMLVSKIPYAPVPQMILSSGSPQEGWRIFGRYHEVREGTGKARVIKDWHKLKQGKTETPRDFLARAVILRTKLEGHQSLNDVQANHHIATALSELYFVESAILRWAACGFAAGGDNIATACGGVAASLSPGDHRTTVGSHGRDGRGTHF